MLLLMKNIYSIFIFLKGNFEKLYQYFIIIFMMINCIILCLKVLKLKSFNLLTSYLYIHNQFFFQSAIVIQTSKIFIL